MLVMLWYVISFYFLLNVYILIVIKLNVNWMCFIIGKLFYIYFISRNEFYYGFSFSNVGL